MVLVRIDVHPSAGIVNPERAFLVAMVAYEDILEGRDMGVSVHKCGNFVAVF